LQINTPENDVEEGISGKVPRFLNFFFGGSKKVFVLKGFRNCCPSQESTNARWTLPHHPKVWGSFVPNALTASLPYVI
jgi:hypothetical protein